METRTLQFIAESCGGRVINGDPETSVRDVSTDSRAVQPGNLFVALSGPNFDGHDFLGEVYRKGAAAAVINEKRASPLPQGFPCVLVADTRAALGKLAAAYRRQFDLTTVAVAGSNGKTSTKEV